MECSAPLPKYHIEILVMHIANGQFTDGHRHTGAHALPFELFYHVVVKGINLRTPPSVGDRWPRDLGGDCARARGAPTS